MSYVDAVLAPGESIMARGRPHWVYRLRAFAELIVLGVFIVGIYLFIRDVTYLLTTEIALTNQRLIKKTGFISRNSRELQLSSVEVIDLTQDFWGRLLGYGSVRVHGTGDDTWSTPLIADPVGFRRNLESALLAYGGRARFPAEAPSKAQ